MRKYFVNLLMPVLLLLANVNLVLAGVSPASMGAAHQFYYSRDFAQRFNLSGANAVGKWQGEIGILIRSENSSNPAECSLGIYLGQGVAFDFPPGEGFSNFLGEQVSQLFFFQPQLSDSDERYLSRRNQLGANRILIEGLNTDGRSTAMESLTISTIDKDVLPGVHIINTYPFFCDILNTTRGALAVKFLSTYKDGDKVRSKAIGEYRIHISQ
ncbi:MAG: hypothetical protein OEZ43_05595 [Gammaproteobacteria bacterium]|nr:hypothetical protein [Gammaproteobacteria bacterium]